MRSSPLDSQRSGQPLFSRKTLSQVQTISALLTLIVSSGCASLQNQRPIDTKAAEGASGIVGPISGDWKEVRLVGDKKAYRTDLKNGLRVILVPDRSSPTFAYQTWFNVGSRDEEIGKTGLAHLFEHLMFKGTKNHPTGEFEKRLDTAGAEGQNAFTSNDFTAYVQELPKERLEMIVELESDRMTQLIVDEQLFKTEREVVQNERRQRTENSPEGLMYQEMYELAFEKHPYRWPVIGYQKDLDSMSFRDAEDFYKSHYSPRSAVVIVTGDVELDDTLKLIKKYYGRIGNPELPPAAAIPMEPKQATVRRKTLMLNMEVEKLFMAYKIPEANHPDLIALSVLDGILSGGRSARLPRALTDTGVTRTAWSHVAEGKDPGLFLVGATLQKGRKAVQAERMILSEIQRIRTQGVTQEEVDRTLNRLEFSYLEGLRTNKGLAEFIGENELTYGNFERGLQIYEAMRKVKPEEIKAVAMTYLNPEARTVLLGIPKSSASSSEKNPH